MSNREVLISGSMIYALVPSRKTGIRSASEPAEINSTVAEVSAWIHSHIIKMNLNTFRGCGRKSYYRLDSGCSYLLIGISNNLNLV